MYLSLGSAALPNFDRGTTDGALFVGGTTSQAGCTPGDSIAAPNDLNTTHQGRAHRPEQKRRICDDGPLEMVTKSQGQVSEFASDAYRP